MLLELLESTLSQATGWCWSCPISLSLSAKWGRTFKNWGMRKREVQYGKVQYCHVEDPMPRAGRRVWLFEVKRQPFPKWMSLERFESSARHKSAIEISLQTIFCKPLCFRRVLVGWEWCSVVFWVVLWWWCFDDVLVILVVAFWCILVVLWWGCLAVFYWCRGAVRWFEQAFRNCLNLMTFVHWARFQDAF